MCLLEKPEKGLGTPRPEAISTATAQIISNWDFSTTRVLTFGDVLHNQSREGAHHSPQLPTLLRKDPLLLKGLTHMWWPNSVHARSFSSPS